MASIPNLHNDNLTTGTEARPEHHVHKASEPLPGARGGAPTADYSADTMERLPSSVWQDADPSQPTRETSELQSTRPDTTPSGRNAFSEQRPLNTEPHPEGELNPNFSRLYTLMFNLQAASLLTAATKGCLWAKPALPTS
jgi:hypothetical protein